MRTPKHPVMIVGLKMITEVRKSLGSYYTPREVAAALVQWAVRDRDDILLDPACGDGRFLAAHTRSVGIECDPAAVAAAHARAPWSRILVGDFFDWVGATKQRFDCAAGNPPFIRYQRFNGAIRESALKICERLGVKFSRLTSSWAPFLAATTSLLKSSGRMAFVVPAEIGHAPYAVPLLKFLATRFASIHIVAVREKMFPDLSEDAWLLLADGFGGQSSHIRFSAIERFDGNQFPPTCGEGIGLDELVDWNGRLRPFLLKASTRRAYQRLLASVHVRRLKEMAHAGIGYVTGANDFFHLRPSEAKQLGIPDRFLVPSIRSSRYLNDGEINDSMVRKWLSADEPVLLLRIKPTDTVPAAVRRYLDSPAGVTARGSYKCRNRSPWYAVPDVRVPDAFLSYMSGDAPLLVKNAASCVACNTVHAVFLQEGIGFRDLSAHWDHPLAKLSFELEGHPLGGGMLKLEPREAGQIALATEKLQLSLKDSRLLQSAYRQLREWRHYD